MRSRYSLTAGQERLQASLFQYAELAEDLKTEIRELLDQLRLREFSVNLRHHGVDRLNDDTLERASRILAYASIIVGLLVGSSIPILAEELGSEPTYLADVGIVGIGLAAIPGLAATATTVRGWLARRRSPLAPRTREHD